MAIRMNMRQAEGAQTAGQPIICIGPTVDKVCGTVSGQAMMFQLLLDALDEMGNQVIVFDITERNSPQTSARTEGGFGLQRILDYLKILPGLWRVLLSTRATVYLTTAQSMWGFLRDIGIIWPAWLLRHPIVAHQFGGNYAQFYARQSALIKFVIRQTLRRADTVIVEGDFSKIQLTFLPGWEKKVRSIPNGLPERSVVFPEAPKSINPTQPFSILYLSNLLETKGYWDVLEAVRILVNEKQRRVQCRFVGKFLMAQDSIRFPDSASAQIAFQKFIDLHRLSEVVSHIGSLFGSAKAAAFQEAHVFALPSNFINEGQPVSVLEAMAYGTVVITCEHRLIPSMVVHEETGFFVRYGHPEEISAKIEFLMDHPEHYRQMSENSLHRFHDLFRADRYVARMAEVFRELQPRASRGH